MLAVFLFVVTVVATPREAVLAYAIYATFLFVLSWAAAVGPRFVLRRLTFELPFIAFALFLPLLGGGERVDVLGLSLSREGLWAAWNIVVKATLGLWATVLLAATTQTAPLLRGLERLRVPRIMTAIAGFMIRYADVITGEMRRMKIARESRGFDARWAGQTKAVASSAGSLFIRSYERGERVYLAMLSRGFSGSLPEMAAATPPLRDWAVALSLPAAGAIVCLAAWAIR